MRIWLSKVVFLPSNQWSKFTLYPQWHTREGKCAEMHKKASPGFRSLAERPCIGRLLPQATYLQLCWRRSLVFKILWRTVRGKKCSLGSLKNSNCSLSITKPSRLSQAPQLSCLPSQIHLMTIFTAFEWWVQVVTSDFLNLTGHPGVEKQLGGLHEAAPQAKMSQSVLYLRENLTFLFFVSKIMALFKKNKPCQHSCTWTHSQNPGLAFLCIPPCMSKVVTSLMVLKPLARGFCPPYVKLFPTTQFRPEDWKCISHVLL